MWEVVASIGAPVVVGGVFWAARKIQAHDVSISVITAQLASVEQKMDDSRHETRQDFRDVKETLNGLTRHILTNHQGRPSA